MTRSTPQTTLTLPQFWPGKVLDSADLQALSDGLSLLQKTRIGTTYAKLPPRMCILDSALEPAADGKRTPTQANATWVFWSESLERLVERTANPFVVWNHSETLTFDSDTLGVAFWVGGHWVFFGDCSPLGLRVDATDTVDNPA